MKSYKYLLFLLVIIIAFWQVVFLQNGMKWDFVDAFLTSRYFFSESILNNQFPLWNPYLLYGTPIYADLVSVFNPEFWLVANMFGYSNITLQLMYLAYIFIAGISFYFFLKLFKTEQKLAIGLSIAYMLSGFTIGNAQHLAFVSGYALLPVVIYAYTSFLREINLHHFLRLALVLFIMVYCSYPALTIILAYLLLSIFVFYLIKNRGNKSFFKKAIVTHFLLIIVAVLFSLTLLVSYVQIAPFLERFGGLPIELAQKHPFSVQSLVSFLFPMAVGNDPEYFQTDISMSNAYFGIISLVLLLFSFSKKSKFNEAYIFLIFGIFSLFASFGDHFFLRGFLYKFAPLMNMFQYPSLFRAFSIFGFLAFIGIGFSWENSSGNDKRKLLVSAVFVLIVILTGVLYAAGKIDHFVFFEKETIFLYKLFKGSHFNYIVFQGIIQIFLLLLFIVFVLKIKSPKYFLSALLFLFVLDGIISTQLNLHYTVVGVSNPVKFYQYLKSSPKGFPIPEMNPIGENSDKNASNEFTWMNNNVFPKKVTFDGTVAFKSDGYKKLADNYPELLEAIKKEALVYFSDDVRLESSIVNFKTNTVFLNENDFKIVKDKNLGDSENNVLEITGFSPTEIQLKTKINHAQLLVYQQNFYTGWRVFVDGIEQELLKSNFTHMAVFVPAGEHAVLFKYENKRIINIFIFTSFLFFTLLLWFLFSCVRQHPERKKQVVTTALLFVFFFVFSTSVHRYFYQKNKLGLGPEISEKVESWKNKYKNNIRILLSTNLLEFKNQSAADTICFVDEKTNLAELSDFLMYSESHYFAFAWQNGIINAELFELIFSFYPDTLEFETSSNSGFLLSRKNTEIQNYQFIQTFEEEETPEWIQSYNRLFTDKESGNRSYFFKAENEWGTTFKLPITKDLPALENVVVLLDLKMEETGIETLLVFSVERDRKTKINRISKINRFAKSPQKWSRAVAQFQIDTEIQEGDEIKIFFWNKNRASFQIDNIKLKFYLSEVE